MKKNNTNKIIIRLILIIYSLCFVNLTFAENNLVAIVSTSNNLDNESVVMSTSTKNTPLSTTTPTTTEIKYNCSNEKSLSEKITFYNNLIEKQNTDIDNLIAGLNKIEGASDDKLLKNLLKKNRITLKNLFENLLDKETFYIDNASNTLSIACVKKTSKSFNTLNKNLKVLKSTESEIVDLKLELNDFIKIDIKGILETLISDK